MQALLNNTLRDSKNKKAQFLNSSLQFLFKASLILTVFSLALIVLYILWNGLKLFRTVSPAEFFLGIDWEPASSKKFGILPMIISSLYITGLSVLISTPIGVACAVFAAELAGDNLKKIIQASVQILAGTPSVVFGLIGLSVIAPWIQTLAVGISGRSILAAVIILSIMIVPTIVSISQDVIQSVPTELKNASLALGATHFQTIAKVILPAAKPGIITAVVLAISRAFGEAMAVKMVIGNMQTMPDFSGDKWFGLLSSARTLTTNIIGDIEYAKGNHLEALFATGTVLFVVIMCVNYAAYLFRRQTYRVKA